ncbi:MAG: TolC family protein [Sulfuricella sp.]|nr:TolC family protein [Sulfuricella sp.]
MKYPIITIFMAVLGLAPAALALPLSLTDALQLAESRHPQLAAAQAQEQAAQAALESAQAYPNPELEIGAGSFRPRQPGADNGRATSIGLAQPIEWPALRNARGAAAQAGIAASTAELTQARQSLRAQVKLTFFEVLHRNEEWQVARENHALLQQIRDRIKIKTEVGESPRYELVKAEAETLAADNAVKRAGLRVEQTLALLRTLLGISLPEQIEPQAEALPEFRLPPLETLKRDMLAQQPLLHAAAAETRRAQSRIEMERSLRLPQPTLKWSAERDPEAQVWRVGVSLPLPLWNRRDGPINEALAELRRAEAEQQRRRNALVAELEQAYARFEIANTLVDTFRSGLLREAENALRVAEAAFRYGERSLLEYLDAQRTLRATRLDYLAARYELLAAQIEIERLRATPLTEGQP